MIRDYHVFFGVLDAANIGVSFLNRKGMLLWVSDGLCRTLGRQRDVLIDRPPQEYLKDLGISHEELSQGFRQILADPASLDGLSDVREFRHGVTGRPVWLRTTLKFGELSGEPVGILISEDVTQMKEQTQDLLCANQDLEQFAYMVSHDLKQPLRMIASFAELLASRYGEQIDDKGRTWMARISDNARMGAQLIEDMLAFSRAGRMIEGLQWLEAHKTITRCLEYLGEGATFQMFEESVFLYAVPTHLESLFCNLISNAGKYRHPDRPLHLEIGHEHKEGMEVFWFKDNGMGISEDLKGKLFEPFKFYHPHGQPGSGIGLAICKRVVNFYRGSIEVESQEDVGTTFTLRFPTTAREPLTGSPSGPVGPSSPLVA